MESVHLSGGVYSLDHLHYFSFDLLVPAKDGKPERSYRLNITFSLHCFSRSPRPGEAIPADLAYSDSRETRIFCVDRYRQSQICPRLFGAWESARASMAATAIFCV